MIEITDEMLIAWRDAMAAKAAELVSAGAPLGSSKDVARAGLAAVLAIVEKACYVGERMPARCLAHHEARVRCRLASGPTGMPTPRAPLWFSDVMAMRWP
jgi:hypothetical protein